MFSGIGSGVGVMSSPVPAGAQLPYTSAGLVRRDDLDGIPPDGNVDPNARNGRDSARGKRRKLKEEDGKEDDMISGRLSPAGRVKRPKTHSHHHHQYVQTLPLSSLLSVEKLTIYPLAIIITITIITNKTNLHHLHRI
jgi:hypothetical protein